MALRKAKRDKLWLKILLNGPSGCGKSYSALRLATGLQSKVGGEIAFVGTESSRDEYYANEFDYMIDSLTEPPYNGVFSIENYKKAITECIKDGAKIIIIDSLTPEWTWLNQVHSDMRGNSFQNWGKLKPMHNDFMQWILSLPVHIVATARGRDEWVMEDEDGKKIPKKTGLGAQQDKDITYNYTVSFMLDQDTHIAKADKDNTHIFDQKPRILTEEDGVALYSWANEGEAPAPTEMPKEIASQNAVDEIGEIKKKILVAWNERGGSKNEAIGAVIKKLGNPNAIKTLEQGQEYLTEIEKIPVK